MKIKHSPVAVCFLAQHSARGCAKQPWTRLDFHSGQSRQSQHWTSQDAQGTELNLSHTQLCLAPAFVLLLGHWWWAVSPCGARAQHSLSPSLSLTLSPLLSVMLDLKKPFFPHLPALGSACWLHRFLIQISHTNFCLKRSFAFESPRGRILEIGIFTVWCRKAQPGNLMLKCTHSNSGEQDTCGVWAVGWKY